MAKHYKVNNETKTITVNMVSLEEEEIKVLKNYIAFGYTVIANESKKKEVKIASKEEKALNPYSAMNIQKYLKEEAGINEIEGDENKGKAYIDIYWDLYKAPLKSGAVYQNDSEDGMFKKGEPRVKGHVGTLRWFKTTFPDYKESEWVKNNIKTEVKNKENK